MANAYVYAADLYCEACALDIRSRLPAPPDASCFDSGDYPAGPYPDGGGEADSPQHCASCGAFLANKLTADGVRYVAETLGRSRPGSKARTIWAEAYAPELAELAAAAELPVARIGKAWTQWFVTPPGGRGGIPVASMAAAVALCRERGWKGERMK